MILTFVGKSVENNFKRQWSLNVSAQVSTLFRAGSLATTLMVQYMKMTSTNFIHVAVKDSVQKIVELKQSCEVSDL